MFVDDDVVVEPDCAANLLGFWERYGIGAAAGMMATVVNGPWEMRTLPRVLRAVLGQSHVALRADRTRLVASGHVAFGPFPPHDQETESPEPPASPTGATW